MTELSFFPIDIDYIDREIKAEIRIFGKTIDGKRICAIDKNFQPYFWIVSDDLKKIKEKVERIKDEDYEVTNTEIDIKIDKGKSIEALKVYVDHPRSVPKIKKIIEDSLNARTMESDILFVRRYLIDKEIYLNKKVKVKGKIIPSKLDVDYCLEIEEISPEEGDFENKKILSFDIETYAELNKYPVEDKDPIISLAFFGENFKKVITWKKFKTKEKIFFVNSEAELIEEFVKTIKEYKPDYLIGYFSDGFDFPYIAARAKKYSILLDISLDSTEIKLIRKGMQSTRIIGIVHIDIFKFIRNIMGGSLQLDNYTLGEVSKQLINKKKFEIDLSKISLIWDNNEEIEKICMYNLNDAEITYELFNKVLPNLEELVKIVGVPIYDVARMSFGQLVEWHLIRRAKEFNLLVPNKPSNKDIVSRKMKTYQGAYVFIPKPGLYENLAILDFRSMYPSIISSKNIDPSTLSFDKEDSYETPEIEENNKKIKYYFNYKEEGFLPKVVKDLLIRRSRIKEMLKKEEENKILEARSYGLKIVLNSIYGYTGYFNARFYCRECASSITAFGRYYINEIARKAGEYGFEAVYGDTDSLVILLNKKNKDDVINFLSEINKELPSLMELELENFYLRGIFVMKKSSSIGAKKKYALIDEKNILKVRGFETIRRDWSYLAKEVQREILRIILKEADKEKAINYTKDIINKVRNKKIKKEKMIIRSRLRKEILSYDQIGPRVIIARRMQELGISVNPGTNVEYIVVEGKGLVRDRVKLPDECEEDEYDSEYYVENQVIPAVKMIFESLGYKEEDISKDSKQKNLGDFS